MPRGAKRRPINHGTPGGYQTHWARGEVACKACKEAKAAKQKEMRTGGADWADNERRRKACTWRARKVLSELHRAEFLRLYRLELEREGLT